MSRTFAAAVAAFLLTIPVARAAPAPASPSTAVALARFTIPKEIWKQTTDAIGAQVEQMASSSATAQGREQAPNAEALAGFMNDLITYDELIDLCASIFTKHYTTEELEQLLAFYRTPLGQKMIRLQPEIMQDVNGQMTVLIQKRMPALLEKLQHPTKKP